MLLRNDLKESSEIRRIINSSDLEYRGNFTRGVSFGNTQDVILNSNLNLQLLGDLGDGLMIKAAISDENIPLQTQGNTQYLQDFNKIFIEISKGNTSIVAGDYELSRPNSYFINYFKKLQGMSVNTRHTINDQWNVDNKASFAVSRGKFRRVNLETNEGNQGPYRLDGDNGEVFLQVLSGTEKIYADGRLLTRGENNDYVIDYNRAEITFTPRCIITANLRIIVEFEYAVQSYLRTLYATETNITNEKWAFNISSYSEQDSKSVSGNIQLDTSDIRILEEGGDDQNFRSGIFPADTDQINDNILYRINNNILEYTSEESADLYSVRFSNFGENNGDYIIDSEAAANGRVYKYVGDNMGNFRPLIRLVPPEQKQIFSASSKYFFSDSSAVSLESSVSHLDLNRFSAIDNEDNTGLGILASVRDLRQMHWKNNWTLESQVSYEFVNKNFEALNPFRVQEFIRDWNIEVLEENMDQHLVNSMVGISNKYYGINYSFGSLRDQGQYMGYKHRTELEINKGSWFLNVKTNDLNTEISTRKSSFSRPRVNFLKSFKGDNIRIGSYFEKEKNIFQNDLDTLSEESFNYDLIRFFLEKGKKGGNTWRIAYSTRLDDRVVDGQLKKISQSQNLEFGGYWKHGQGSRLQWQFVLREFKVDDEYLEFESPNKAFIGNLDHNLTMLNNGITVTVILNQIPGRSRALNFNLSRFRPEKAATSGMIISRTAYNRSMSLR